LGDTAGTVVLVEPSSVAREPSNSAAASVVLMNATSPSDETAEVVFSFVVAEV
jgi:hypothetical protein